MYCWRLKELCTKLVFWKVYTTMHGQKNIKVYSYVWNLNIFYTSDSQYGVRSTVKPYDSAIPSDMLTVPTRRNKFPTDVLDDTDHRFIRRRLSTIPPREATRLSYKVKVTVRTLEKVCQLFDLDVCYSKTCRTLLTGIEPSPYTTVQVATRRQILICNHT